MLIIIDMMGDSDTIVIDNSQNKDDETKHDERRHVDLPELDLQLVVNTPLPRSQP